MDFVIFRSAGGDTEEKQELSGEEQAQIESKKQQVERQLSNNKKTYEKVRKIVQHAQDPIEPINAL